MNSFHKFFYFNNNLNFNAKMNDQKDEKNCNYIMEFAIELTAVNVIVLLS